MSVVAMAQTPPPAATPPPDPAPAPVWSIGPIDFSGLVDVYADKNLNNPASMTNGLRNFDLKANQFTLNMAKLTMEHGADPVGFRVDLGFGRAFETINGADPAGGDINRHIEQAYVSLKPPKGKGFQLDIGKFVTSAGAEVIETKDNWNYSRSLLFAWAIPYYHFGARASMPMGAHFTGGVQLVNGWNNFEDNNSGKTVGFTGAVTSKKANWYNNFYTGPENTANNKGFRNLYDTTLLLTPADQFNAYINFDYGQNKDPLGVKSSWKGVAVAAKMAPTSSFAITPRVEWFNDEDGFATGTAQKVKEFTITGEYKMKEGLLARLEYRRDWSDVSFFERGPVGTSKNQNTILIGFVAYFGPKR